MKFYYENYLGDSGFFSEKDLVKAIYTAWNIEADLYLVTDKNIKKIKDFTDFFKQTKIIFLPNEDNNFNSSTLKEYGYYMEDGEEEREIKEINTRNIVKYDWSEVKQLI